MEAEIRYAKAGDVHLAYRVFGDGPRDVVLVPGTISHVELYWELPANAYLLKRLSSFARVIVFDKRGQGLSDRVAEQTLEERVSDVQAVMDAAGSDRATIYGWSEGGQMSLTFAAIHPERTSGLILYGTYASMTTGPWTVTSEQFARFLATVEKHWGEGILVKINAPSRVKDQSFVQWFGRLERAVASPGSIVSLMRANYEIDILDLLPSIRVPTLILHRVGDALVPVDAGRHLAQRIPGARYVELPGDDHLLQAFDQEVLDLLLDRIEEFITGSCHPPKADQILRTTISNDAPADSGDATTTDGPLAEAIAELEKCRDMIASGDETREVSGLIARAQALVAAAQGSWDESDAQFVKAVKSFRRHKMAWEEANTFRIWGRALLSGVDRRKLVEKLDSAIEIYRHRSASNGSPRGTEGSVVSAARRNGSHGAVADSTRPAATGDAIFRREGDYWTVAWHGNLVRLRDAKGLRYLAHLLANPGRQVLARELAMVATARNVGIPEIQAGGARGNLGDAGALLDAKACEQYRRRISELQEEAAQADRLNDIERAARLRSEMESIGNQIAAAVGLGGRIRRSASHNERARLMVTKAIKAAIAKIRVSNAPLGRHLATSVKTGNFCVYDPDPACPALWHL